MSFNELNPPTSSLLISGDMRANFLATRRHMFSANLLQDPLFECWPTDDSTVPATWRLTGTGATIARVTAAVDVAVGKMATRVTFGSSAALLRQFILDSASYDDYFDNRVFTAGCFVKSATAGIARIQINDGGGSPTFSAFHPGGDVFQFLDLEHVIDPGATQIDFRCSVEAAGNAIFSAPVVLFSDIKPDRFVLPVTMRSTIVHSRRGETFVGQVDRYAAQRAYIVEHVQLDLATTLVTGADLIVDINQWDGAFTSMFTGGGRPRIVDGVGRGGAKPDGVYNRRCFIPIFGQFTVGSLEDGSLLQSIIDQVGSTTPGTDLNIYIRVKGWARPQELLADVAMVN